MSTFPNWKGKRRMLLLSFLSSHSIHLFNYLRTEIKHPNSFEWENFLIHNNLCKKIENSTELETIFFMEIFSSTKRDVSHCYKLLSNLKNFDIPEKIADPEKQKMNGCHALSNAFNKVFVSIINAWGNYLNDFTDNELNEVEISIEIAKDGLNASSEGFGPDLTPGQVWRKVWTVVPSTSTTQCLS